MLRTRGVIRPQVNAVLDRLTKVPVDIAPRSVTAENLLGERGEIYPRWTAFFSSLLGRLQVLLEQEPEAELVSPDVENDETSLSAERNEDEARDTLPGDPVAAPRASVSLVG
jgi:hypothetical protein